MKKSAQDTIEGKTLKRRAWVVEVVSIPLVAEDSHLHLLSTVDLVGVVVVLVEVAILVGLSSISDFSKRIGSLFSLIFLW